MPQIPTVLFVTNDITSPIHRVMDFLRGEVSCRFLSIRTSDCQITVAPPSGLDNLSVVQEADLVVFYYDSHSPQCEMRTAMVFHRLLAGKPMAFWSNVQVPQNYRPLATILAVIGFHREIDPPVWVADVAKEIADKIRAHLTTLSLHV